MLQKAEKYSLSDILRDILKTIPHDDTFIIHRCFQVGLHSNWRLPPRINADHKILFIQNGSGYYEINGQRENFTRGKIIFVGAGCQHCGVPDIDNPPQFISLRFSLESGKYAHYPVAGSAIPAAIDKTERIFMDFADAAENELSRISEFNLSEALLYQIIACFYETVQAYSPKASKSLIAAKNLIDKEPLKAHSLKQLASLAGLNERYFARSFKKAFGQSPGSYIVRAKMRQGKRLLLEENLSVQETAWRLGYSDQFIFSRQFSKVYGFPPSKAKYE
jgi:AraC-like DNA-binding protein